MQSPASMLHRRRLRSMTSTSGVPLEPALFASISAPVIWPKSRYSVARGFSTATCAFWYAFRDISQPLLLEVEQCPALNEGLVIRRIHYVFADVHADGQRFSVADRLHELGHAQSELAVICARRVGIEIHHHDREVDPARRRVGVLDLHDVLLAQHTGLV